jgi:hypothetical protein
VQENVHVDFDRRDADPGSKTANKAGLADAIARYWATEFLYIGYHRPFSAVIGD